MFSAYAFRVIMFGPQASPVVQAQSTWHIGPTTCVFTSRSLARLDRDGSSNAARKARSSSTESSSHRANATASSVFLQMKQDARVILSRSTYVRNPPDVAAAFIPRDIEAERPPSVCASGTRISSCVRPVSRKMPAGSSSSYCPSSTASGPTTDTGITAAPVWDSWARDHDSSSCERARSPTVARIASRRAWIDSASFLRGHFTRRAYSRVVATWMDGKALAARFREEVAREVDAFSRPIGLATVLVGDDPASDVYIRMKHKATLEVGIEARDLRLPARTTEEELLALVTELNADEAIDGILVQLPLPEQIDEGRVIRAVDPVKDVDGFHPVNAGLLLAGTPGHVPGTPLGVLALLDEYGVELRAANAVVIGRSDIVGKPVALLLLHRHATVTICHSRTRDLAAHALRADVIVAAVGVPGLVRPELVKEGAAVIDVGITRTENGLVGDVDPAVAERAGLLTPVPGGVGPMTIAMLLRSTVRAARYRLKEVAHPAS